MKARKCLFLMTFVFVFFAVADSYALSDRTVELLVALKAKIKHREESLTELVAPQRYIPGELLKVAMRRMRDKVYGPGVISPVSEEAFYIDNPQLAMPEPPIKTEQDDQYRPGSLLQKALANIRSVKSQFSEYPTKTDSFFDTEKLQERLERQIKQENQAQQSSKKLEQQKPKLQKIDSASLIRATSSKKSAKTTPDVSFKGSYSSKKVSQEIRRPMLGSQHIKPAEPISDATSINDAKQSDTEFNEFLQKYEFKMPKNYRIIVR